MYLLDDRFSTMVAFVEGFNTAFDGVPLRHFQHHVAARVLNRRSSLHWAYIIASTKMPAILDDKIGIDQIPAEFDAALSETLIDALDELILLDAPG